MRAQAAATCGLPSLPSKKVLLPRLSYEQIEALEHFSPEFRERHTEARHTGDLVAIDTFFVSHLKGVDRSRL